MLLTSSVTRQSMSNFRLYCCSKKIQMLRKKVKLLLEQLQVCIFAEIIFGVRCTLRLHTDGWYVVTNGKICFCAFAFCWSADCLPAKLVEVETLQRVN